MTGQGKNGDVISYVKQDKMGVWINGKWGNGDKNKE